MNEDDKRERPVAGDMADAAGRDTPFLQRWSARKTRARSAAEQQPVAEHPPAATEPAAAVAAEARPELTDADMPPLEAIDATTDVSGFSHPKSVPNCAGWRCVNCFSCRFITSETGWMTTTTTTLSSSRWVTPSLRI
jgi:hypothetical protein